MTIVESNVTATDTATLELNDGFRKGLPAATNSGISLADLSAMSENAHRFKVVSELTSDFAYCFRVGVDGELSLEWMTDSVSKVTGYDIDYINSKGWQYFLYHEDLPLVFQQWERLLSGLQDSAEYRVHGANHQVIWIRNHARPEWDESEQRVKYIYGAAQDITEHRLISEQLALEQDRIRTLNTRLEMALREGFHRIKNNLQMVSSLIMIQAMDHDGSLPRDQVGQLIAHINAMAAVHTLILRGLTEDGESPTVSVEDLMRSLCSLLNRAMAGREIRYEVGKLNLPGRQATCLALVTNELIQNACKHATGNIEVLLYLQDAVVSLEVLDEGPGFGDVVKADDLGKIGLNLVRDLTSSELGGSVSFESRPTGGGRVTVQFSWNPT